MTNHGIGGSTAEAELASLVPWPMPAASITAAERAQRLARAQALMAEIGAEALIVGAGPSLRYFTGVGWNPTERLVAMILPRVGGPTVVCPRFELGSLEAALGIEAEIVLWEEHESPYALAASVLAGLGARTLAIDPALPFFAFDGLRLASPGVTTVNAAPIIDGCRMIKSAAELALMRQAKAMTLEVHRRAALILAEGITTTAVRRFIDQAHRALGADDGSSFCAVQFGVASAYPHGLPGEQRAGAGATSSSSTPAARSQATTPTSPAPMSSASLRRTSAGSGRSRNAPRPPPSPPSSRVCPARRLTPSPAASWKPRASARTMRCPACRTARDTASAFPSTRRLTWCAATRPRSPPACAFPTSR